MTQLKGLNGLFRKKWQVASYDKNLAAQIAQDHSLNPFVALLAASRGIENDDEISTFFDDYFVFCDPFELPDMDKAVIRLTSAIENNESIVVFGDYDADGVTSTALLVSYLEARGADVRSYIPDRQTEGYGLSIDAVNALKQMGAKLVVTVDNGVSAIDEANLFAETGMDLIITDHHKPKDIIPNALAVIDPYRKECSCKFKDFAGVGVVFKLVCALDGGDPDELLFNFADLLAIGTIGDVVPLKAENRAIVKQGIKSIANFTRIGIEALLEVAGARDKRITSSSVAFIISPRINAAGRMGSANRALELLLTEDEYQARELAEEINEANILRQKTEIDICKKVEEQFCIWPARKCDRIIVVDGEGWHSGVIGIVASRMVEKYGRPCIIISKEGGIARGSGRSIEGFSLYDALNAVSEMLTHFGGHTLAAGLGIESDRINDFRVAINSYASRFEMPYPLQRIDFRLNPKSISVEMNSALAAFEPFGAENPQPVFGLYKMRIEETKPVSEGKHTRLLLSKEGTKVAAIIFNAKFDEFAYRQGDLVDLAVVLENNEYKETVSVNTQIRNIRLSNINEDKILAGIRIYEKFIRGESISKTENELALPDRNIFAEIYRTIKSNKGEKHNFEVICLRIDDDGGKICAVLLAVEAMLELGILVRNGDNAIEINPMAEKVNIENSKIMQRLRNYLN